VPAALADRIAAAFPHLSKKHREIATFVLEHEDLVAFASTHEVGLETDSSAATVVRFCQVLGYEGYQQLQEAIRAQLSLERTAVQHLERQLEGTLPHDDPAQIMTISGTCSVQPCIRGSLAGSSRGTARQAGAHRGSGLWRCWLVLAPFCGWTFASRYQEQLALSEFRNRGRCPAASFRRTRYAIKRSISPGHRRDVVACQQLPASLGRPSFLPGDHRQCCGQTFSGSGCDVD
jgi:hypothetical protein